MSTKQENIEAVDRVCELLGLTRAELVAAAANGGAQNTIDDLAEQAEEKPAPIVYPNIKFPRYKFREYPKATYGNARFEDVIETVTRLVPREGGGVDQRVFERVIPDQFRYDTRNVASKAEENTLPAGWYLTLDEAKEAARQAKANARPIVERPARGRPRKQHAAGIGTSQIATDYQSPSDDDGDDAANPMQENAA